MDPTFTYLATLSRTVLSRPPQVSGAAAYGTNGDEQNALRAMAEALNESLAQQARDFAAAAELGKQITAQLVALRGLKRENRELQVRVAAELATRLAAATADPGLLTPADRQCIIASLENIGAWATEANALATHLAEVVDRATSASSSSPSIVGPWAQVAKILDSSQELALQMKKALLECRILIVDGKSS